MSVASMSGYLPSTSTNPAVNPAFGLTVLTPTLLFPNNIANNTSENILNAFVVPKGTWLISGIITGKIITVGNIVKTGDLNILKNGIVIYNPFLSAVAFAVGIPVSTVFTSNGTDTLTIALECLVSKDDFGAPTNPDTWKVADNTVGETNITLIKIAN
jgi:hypothetical protein